MAGIPSPGPERIGQLRWYLPTLMLVVLAMGIPRIAVEAPFFRSGAIIHADGSALVPQDDANSAPIDQAFRVAGAVLPREITCVIARDSWNRDYFRASYVLMPRPVWPVARLLTTSLPGLATVSRSLEAREARCLLASAGTPIPRGWQRETLGVYSLYVPGPRW